MPPSLALRDTIVNHRSRTQVLQEMRRLRSDPKYFEQGTPMGSEVRLCLRPTLETLEYIFTSKSRLPYKWTQILGRFVGQWTFGSVHLL